MPPWPGFCGGSYQTQSFQADGERTVNLYVERLESPAAKSRAMLLSTPGFQKWTPASSVSDVGGRGELFASGRFFAILGGGFYEFDVTGTPTKWGSVTQDANPAQLVYNGVVGGQILIASGGNAYCFVLASNTFSQVLTGSATQIAYATGFFLAFNKTNGHVALSALNDGTSWPGNFFQRSLLADPWQAMFVDGNSLVWLPGVETFEVWQNTGTGTQPFAPLSGLVGRYGIAAPFAYGMAGAVPYWLSETPEGAGLLIRATGSGIQPVSNYAVANAISGYARTKGITDAELLVYQDQGHTFLVVTFPAADVSWAYDIEGQSWAERGRWNSVTGKYDIWSPRSHAYAFGKHLITDRITGQISIMDATLSTEIDGTGIRRARISPPLFHEDARVPVDQLLLLMDVGVGLVSGQGSDPQIMLRQSADAGKTWGNQRIASIGRLGEFRRRVYFNRLGSLANRTVEITTSDPVPIRIVDAYINPNALEQAA